MQYEHPIEEIWKGNIRAGDISFQVSDTDIAKDLAEQLWAYVEGRHWDDTYTTSTLRREDI